MTLHFTVPGKIVGKQRPRFSRFGGRVTTYTPDKTLNYENLIMYTFASKYPKFAPIQDPVMLTITAHVVKAKSNKMKHPTLKPDCDNVAKCVADALNGIAYVDDKQIIGLAINKIWGDIERLEIKIDTV